MSDFRLLVVVNNAIAKLAEAGVDNPALDARLLAACVLGCDRAGLLTQHERILTADELSGFESLIGRRECRESVARILGLREFWGLPFGLNEATLEPRPDSETLIETVIASRSGISLPPLGGGLGGGSQRNSEPCLSAPSHTTPHPTLPPRGEGLYRSDVESISSILDLGTGTGCLLLALLHEFPDASGVGVDIAPRAVEQSRINAARLGMAERATFTVGNWLDGVSGTFDVIVSNPPYIASAEIPALMPEVRDYDPLAALDGGTDGLAPYRHLIPKLPDFLKPDGLAIFEVGRGQAESVRALFDGAGFVDISTRKDLNGIERCVTGRRREM